MAIYLEKIQQDFVKKYLWEENDELKFIEKI